MPLSSFLAIHKLSKRLIITDKNKIIMLLQKKMYAHVNVAYKLSQIAKSLMPNFLDPIERTQ